MLQSSGEHNRCARIFLRMKAKILKKFEDEVMELERELHHELPEGNPARARARRPARERGISGGERSAGHRQCAHRHAEEADCRDLDHESRQDSARSRGIRIDRPAARRQRRLDHLSARHARGSRRGEGAHLDQLADWPRHRRQERRRRDQVITPNGTRNFEIVKLVTIHDEA